MLANILVAIRPIVALISIVIVAASTLIYSTSNPIEGSDAGIGSITPSPAISSPLPTPEPSETPQPSITLEPTPSPTSEPVQPTPTMEPTFVTVPEAPIVIPPLPTPDPTIVLPTLPPIPTPTEEPCFRPPGAGRPPHCLPTNPGPGKP